MRNTDGIFIVWAESFVCLTGFCDKFTTLQSSIKLWSLEHCSSSIKVQQTMVSIKMIVNKLCYKKFFKPAHPPTKTQESSKTYKKIDNRLSCFQYHHIYSKPNHTHLDNLKTLLTQQIFSTKTVNFGILWETWFPNLRLHHRSLNSVLKGKYHRTTCTK